MFLVHTAEKIGKKKIDRHLAGFKTTTYDNEECALPLCCTIYFRMTYKSTNWIPSYLRLINIVRKCTASRTMTTLSLFLTISSLNKNEFIRVHCN